MAYALSKMGYSVPGDEEICKTIRLSLPETFVRFTANNDPQASEIFRKVFRERADKVMSKNTVLLDGVTSTVEFLNNRGIRCGIVSTKFRFRIAEVLQRDGLADSFGIVIGGEDVAVAKPDPQGLVKAINSLGAQKEGCLYVGDSITDARTAQNAGIDFVGVLSGVTTREQLKLFPYVRIIKHLAELKKLI